VDIGKGFFATCQRFVWGFSGGDYMSKPVIAGSGAVYGVTGFFIKNHFLYYL